ncbi:MAG: alpha/beta hydrolase, partial [Pauljensenia sp.]
ADVTTWQTGPLESIASDLLAAGKGLSATHEAGEDAASAIQSQGKAVTAMRATTISNLASLERAITNINGALMAVEGARDGVASVLADINALEAFAETNDCTIHPDGSVTGKGTQNARGEASSALAIIGNNIKKILEEADRIDTELFHALSDINNDRYTDANGKAHTGAYDQAQADYNKALAEYETAQAAYDKKRATQIPDDVHKGRAAYDDTELTKARKKMEKAKEIYDDLAAIRNETNNSERRKAGQAETYLLDFNYDKKYERTTAIVSSGNPDTATHVSTLVPGIGTNVRGDLGDYIARNDRLRHQTTHAGLDPANVATISYLGYVAPKNNAADLSITQAADIGFAERGAPKLARFEEGLRASADARGHQFTNTLLGHSYGSTTSGKALPMMAPGTVDNFVMFGSPGSGVRNIDAYGLPEGHVYESSIPDGDAVQGLGPDASYGTNPRKLEGITHLSGDATDAANYWTPTPPSIAGAAGVVERAIHGFDNHMAYFEEGTRTSQDFANIIADAKPTTDEEWEALKKVRGSPQPSADDESEWWKQALIGY